MFTESQLSEIQKLCLRYKVRSLKVFGSFLDEERFNESSDIDFLVIWDEHEELGPFHQYFDLKFALEALLGRSVDLVCEEAIRNPYFKEETEKTNKLVYAA